MLAIVSDFHWMHVKFWGFAAGHVLIGQAVGAVARIAPALPAMDRITAWVLAHKRVVVGFWLVVTLVGIASAGPATKALKQKFSVPGKEGWETNLVIARDFNGTGGNGSPLVPVVTLPAGKTVKSPGVRVQLERIEQRLRRALPRSRRAGDGADPEPSLSPP